MTHRTSRHLALATAAVLSLGLTACSATAEAADERLDNGDLSSVSIGIHSGWDEGIAVSHLFAAILEDEGYTVTSQEADPGIVYTGMSGGDFDVNFDMWLPETHADYLDTYGDDMEDLGAWYDNAKLTVVVNEDSPITSLSELADASSEVGNRIVGIEAGAGLTRIVQDAVVPAYGLEGMDLLISSTPAMLAELKGATDAGEQIVATLWRPHWAYDAYPIRDLEDPEGALGAAEEIHSMGRTDFTADYPTLSSWIKAFRLTDEQLFSLENLIYEGNGADPEIAVRTWLDTNPTFVDDLKAAAQA